MADLQCTSPNDFYYALLGAISQTRAGVEKSNGITETITVITKERMKNICTQVDINQQEKELKYIQKKVQESEKEIIGLLSPQIKANQMNGFFLFGIKGGQLVKLAIFQDIYTIYALQYGIDEADYMEEKMTDPKNEGKTYIVVEYGRNQKNKELFIQRISLKEEK